MRGDNKSLLLDLYELTMAAGYFERERNVRAVFDLFVRRLPKNRSFLIAAGLEEALEFLKDFSFGQEDIDFLKKKGIFKDSFLDYLKGLRFSGEVWAMPEGTVFFPGEPVLRVSAPILEAQMVESALLNIINIASLISSKAARVVLAAKGKGVYDFSLRRTQGMSAALAAARSSYITGCLGTSNVLAGKLYGMPTAGTMAHSFVMSFHSELESFRAYTSLFPDNSILLVDTYDYRKGIENAITAARELEAKGHKLKGVRLDSGDLARISIMARRLLDKAGLNYIRIFASGNLDEFKIDNLLKNGAKIDSFGVGTNMGTSCDAPYLDVIYKLSRIDNSDGSIQPVMKLSKDKITYPGKKQVFRIRAKDGFYLKDIIGLEGEKIKGKPLLEKVMENGKITISSPLLDTIRVLAEENIRCLRPKYKKLKARGIYPVSLSPALKRMIEKLKQDIALRN